MILFVDAGNTAIKFALKNNNSFNYVLHFSSHMLFTLGLDVLTSDLQAVLGCKEELKVLLYSSSRPQVDPIIKELAHKWGLQFYQAKKNLSFEVKLLNPDHWQRMGADLLLYAYLAKQEAPKGKAVVVSVGTASTLTFLQDGVVQGCHIACGIMTASRALSEKAEMIDIYRPVPQNSLFGLNTQEALNLGLLHQHYYGIEKAITLFKGSDSIKIFLTGGDGAMLLPLFSSDLKAMLDYRLYFLCEALDKIYAKA